MNIILAIIFLSIVFYYTWKPVDWDEVYRRDMERFWRERNKE